MAEAPSKVLSTTIRTRAPMDLVARRIEELFEYLSKLGLFNMSKVSENVYLVDVAVRGFLRTIREKLILARSIMFAEKGEKVISFNDVDNKFILTISVFKEKEYTNIIMSCSSLSRLRKLCQQFADIVTRMVSEIEIATVTETITPEVAEEPSVIRATIPPPAPRKEQKTITEAEKAVGEEWEKRLKLTRKYSEVISSEKLAALILRGKIIHRTMIPASSSPEKLVEKILEASLDQKDKIIATITSARSSDILALAVDTQGEASALYSSGEKEEAIDDIKRLKEVIAKLIRDGARLTIYLPKD